MKMEKMLKNYYSILYERKFPKFFELKKRMNEIKKAYKILNACCLCEWKCKVNRHEKLGKCNVKDKMLVSSYFAHYGEEYFFVPSFTIFFYSCNFSCVFCQNYTISHRLEIPLDTNPEQLAKIIDTKAYDCKNINLVGGEPTPYLPFILDTLSRVKIKKPVIWNSNFYFSEEAFSFIKKITDVYLPDFKYGNDECALKLSKIKNYVAIIKRNLLFAKEDENADIVIRHLVLPNHIECCSKPIIDFIAKNLKDRVIVNIMQQYRPYFEAKYEKYKISREISDKEFLDVVKYAKEKELNFIL